MKEGIHPRDFQRLVDPLIHAHQPQTASSSLTIDIGPDQRPNPRRIQQWDIREVQDERARVVGPHLGLKAEYVGKRKWPSQAQNADSRSWPGKIFDV